MQTEGEFEGVPGDVERTPGDVLTETTMAGQPDPDLGVVGRTGGDEGAGSTLEPGESDAPEASVDAVDCLLDEVEQALIRLDDGTYGKCASCGEPIDDAFLADSPATRECASCLLRRDG